MPVSITVRALLLIAVGVAGLPGCSDPEAPPVLTVAAVGASNGQTGFVGTALSQSLRVKVQSDGAPKAGVTVTWEASDGSIAPASSLTDAAGIAATTWILGAVPGAMTVSATVSGAQGSPVTFSATALSLVTVTADPASDGQTGVVGTALSQSLRVKLQSDGAPKAGVTVTWQTSDGSITPTSSRTNAAGVAAATWTLGPLAGDKVAYATVVGAQGPPVRFSATALPGPVSAIHKLDGDAQTTPANHRFRSLIVSVTDQYGNLLAGQAVTWTVESGSLAFVTIGSATDGSGQSAAVVAPSGTPGAAVVRAALPGGGASVDFALTVGPSAPWAVTLINTSGVLAFVSAQNGSSPAVDTIPAGETVTWTDEPFDYGVPRPVSVGTPSFHGAQNLPYAFQVTFTAPGTYHYADSYYPTATGIIVVQ